VNRAEDRGDGCKREPQTFPAATFESIVTGNGYPVLLVCGGDALCTLAELNRTLELPAGDPRHSCTTTGSVSKATTQSISYELGSNRIVSVACDGDPAAVYIKQ